MSYILFGGLFNPPHLGHFNLAIEAYQKIKPEKLIWIPAKYPPHRKSEGLGAEDRFAMLKWCFKDDVRFEVSDMELTPEHSGFSIDTIKQFKLKYPDKKSYFLIGSDEAEKFCDWYHYIDILKESQLIIGQREIEADINDEIKIEAIFLKNKLVSINSTTLRDQLEKKIINRKFYDQKIIDYIVKHGLYFEK